jgi:hypothetical protein
MQRNCHEFIAYENLIGRTGPPRHSGGRDHRRDSQPITSAVPLLTRALTVLSEREGAPPLGLLKTTMLQLDSTFDERSYGAGSFRDFAQKLEKIGVVKVLQGKGGWVVQPADSAPAPVGDVSAGEGAPLSPGSGAPRDRSAMTAPAIVGSPADGVQELIRVLSAAKIRRWPLYLRNLNQVLRRESPSFDERAYGFAQLTDLLRAAQKDGLLRMERDRQGVVRVFQGQAFAVGTHPAPHVQDRGVPDRPQDGNRLMPAAEVTEDGQSDGTMATPVSAAQPEFEAEPAVERTEAVPPAAGSKRRRRNRGTGRRKATPNP